MKNVKQIDSARDVSSPAPLSSRPFVANTNNRQPLPKRWQRARNWFSKSGVEAPNMAQFKIMLEQEFVGAG